MQSLSPTSHQLLELVRHCCLHLATCMPSPTAQCLLAARVHAHARALNARAHVLRPRAKAASAETHVLAAQDRTQSCTFCVSCGIKWGLHCRPHPARPCKPLAHDSLAEHQSVWEGRQWPPGLVAVRFQTPFQTTVCQKHLRARPPCRPHSTTHLPAHLPPGRSLLCARASHQHSAVVWLPQCRIVPRGRPTFSPW